MNPGLSGFWEFLVVFAKPSAPAEPGQGAFHHPSTRQHLELVAVQAPAHHPQQPSASFPGPRYQPAGVGCISPDYLEPGESTQQLGQNQPGSVPVLNVGGVNDYGQEQPGGVHYDVALASRHLFARVIAARPPFPVVFTDWLSMMAPLGVASRPSLSRTMGRSASPTRPPSAIGPLFPEIPPYRAPRRQVVGHHSPGYAATQHVQNAVHHLPQGHGSGMSPE